MKDEQMNFQMRKQKPGNKKRINFGNYLNKQLIEIDNHMLTA